MHILSKYKFRYALCYLYMLLLVHLLLVSSYFTLIHISFCNKIQTLLSIWRDFRENTQKELQHNRLPEPPAARERLKAEIQFFVTSIRDKAKENGRLLIFICSYPFICCNYMYSVYKTVLNNMKHFVTIKIPGKIYHFCVDRVKGNTVHV